MVERMLRCYGRGDMNKFSRSPWSFGKRGKNTQQINGGSWTCLARVYVETHVNGEDLRPCEEGLANARLISKAPEMYELLLKLAPLYGTSPEVASQIHAIGYFVNHGAE
jgi:hypothetical protein